MLWWMWYNPLLHRLNIYISRAVKTYLRESSFMIVEVVSGWADIVVCGSIVVKPVFT